MEVLARAQTPAWPGRPQRRRRPRRRRRRPQASRPHSLHPQRRWPTSPAASSSCGAWSTYALLRHVRRAARPCCSPRPWAGARRGRRRGAGAVRANGQQLSRLQSTARSVRALAGGNGACLGGADGRGEVRPTRRRLTAVPRFILGAPSGWPCRGLDHLPSSPPLEVAKALAAEYDRVALNVCGLRELLVRTPSCRVRPLRTCPTLEVAHVGLGVRGRCDPCRTVSGWQCNAG